MIDVIKILIKAILFLGSIAFLAGAYQALHQSKARRKHSQKVN
jgi:hypothetical protein